MKTIDFSTTVPVCGSFDLIVAGGGVAGVAAALTARREGRSVLLIEKSNILGGLATLGLVNLFVPMCNGRGKQIIKGMAEELLRLSIKYGYDNLFPEWRDGEPKEYTEKRYRTRYSAIIFALCLTEALHNEGVNLLFDSIVTQPVMDGKRCRGVIVDNKSGFEYYEAKQFVDVTGDCDLLCRAGVPTVQGRNFFTFIGKKITLDSCLAAYEKRDIFYAFKDITGGYATLHGKNHPENMPTFTGTTSESVNDFIIKNQLLMLEKLKGEERRSREVVQIPMMPQFRTTRHIDGEYTLLESDAYRHFDDSITALCDMERRDFLFEIPFRTLINKDYPNLITAGRSLSASGYAWDIARVIPPAIVTGQAAAYAACMALDGDRSVAEADIPRLQSKLESANVMIHFDDAWIPSDRESISVDVGEN